MDKWNKSKKNSAIQVYFLIAGLFFLYIPWSALWPEASMLPDFLKIIFNNDFSRGLVSGFGLILFFAGILDYLYEHSRNR